MIVKRLMLSDFGKFHQTEFVLSNGLNIATGANESGKTTVRRFIRSMFYGMERERGIKARKDDYIRFKPWEYGRFQGSLELEAEGETYRLFRNFLTMEKQCSMVNLSTGQEIPDPEAFLQKLGLPRETVYTNAFWIGNACVTDGFLATELREYLVSLACGANGIPLKKSLDWLALRKKEVSKKQPEKELEECMECMGKKERITEQITKLRYAMEETLKQQNLLEEKGNNIKDRTDEAAEKRRVAEKEEKQKWKGERLLILSGMCSVLLGGAAGFLFQGSLLAAALVVAAVILSGGLLAGIPKIRRGTLAGKQKEQLEKQLTELSVQTENYYREQTNLLLQEERIRTSMEQAEEQLKPCMAAEERYEELKQQRNRILKEMEALTLAADTLQQIARELYEEFAAKFAAALSEYAVAFTDHAYEKLTAGEDLNLRAVTAERSLELSDVSFGTGEQFYLALRFAVADVFDPDKKNPVILDDSFAAFDEQRLESAILALSRCGRQVLLFSSTGREEAAAKRMGIAYEAFF